MKKLFAILILLSLSSGAHSFTYHTSSLYLNGFGPIMFCGSYIDPVRDSLLSSFSLSCKATGPGYEYNSPYFEVPYNANAFLNQGINYYVSVPAVAGTHTIAGTHMFWVQEVCGIVVKSNHSLILYGS